MSNRELFDTKQSKPAPCYRIDPETGERLELVTRKNLSRKEPWDAIRENARIRQAAGDTL